MAYLRIDLDLHSQAKTRRLVRAYGHHAFFSLTALWAYAAKHRPDGALTGMSVDDIEAVSEWAPDRPGEFIKALLAVGFLDDIEGIYHIHAWSERQPFIADQQTRSDASRKAAQVRWNSHAKVVSEKGEQTCEAHDDDAERMQPACETHTNDAERSFSDAPLHSIPNHSDHSHSIHEEKESHAAHAPGAGAPFTEASKRSRKQKRKPETQWPYGAGPPTETFVNECREHDVDANAEWRLWRNQMRAHGKTYRDWQAVMPNRVATAVAQGRTISAKASGNGNVRSAPPTRDFADIARDQLRGQEMK